MSFCFRAVLTVAGAIGIGVVVSPELAWSADLATADMAVKAPAQQVSDDFASVTWLNGDFKKDAYAGVIGGLYALDKSVGSTGWQLRGQFIYVNYGYESALSPSDHVNVDFSRASGSVGYQVVGNVLTGSLFAGLEFQRHAFAPGAADPGNLNDRWGLILNGRIATSDNSRYPFAFDAQYSTANNEYWLRARPGIKFGTVTVGPEIGALGNRSYDELRFGGFTAIDLTRNWILQFHLGYADALRVGTGGGSGVYGGSTLVFLY